MAKFRKIDPRIWVDEKFKSLDPETQRFFLYLLTSPHSSSCGAYILPDLYIQADLEISQEQIALCWQALLKADMALRCPKTHLVCLPNWFKYNVPDNAKSSAACLAAVRELPKSEVLTEYCQRSVWLRERLANGSLTKTEPQSNQGDPQKNAENNGGAGEQLAKSSLTVSEQFDGEPEPEPEKEPEPEPENESGSLTVRFASLRGRITAFFPQDKAVEYFLAWFEQTYVRNCNSHADKAVRRLAEIFATAQLPDKESPPKWFTWKVQQPSQDGGLGYSPNSQRRSVTCASN